VALSARNERTSRKERRGSKRRGAIAAQFGGERRRR
jgi:hypothetical protein